MRHQLKAVRAMQIRGMATARETTMAVELLEGCSVSPELAFAEAWPA